MARFNLRGTRPSASSPVTTAGEHTRTHEGGVGHLRDAKSELFLLAVANTVGTDTFYEKAGARDDRFTALVRHLAVEDPAWTAGLLRWLRGEGNMRTASLVGAAEFVKARLDADRAAALAPGPAAVNGAAPWSNRAVIDSVLQRADEPGELLGYWTAQYGRRVPKPVKRGVADAAQRLYTERSLLKYDTDSKGYRFGDVLELVHAAPHPDRPWQGDLFRHAIDRRHGRGEPIPQGLRTLGENSLLRTDARAVQENPGRYGITTSPLLNAERLRAAGMTWEDVLSYGGNLGVAKRSLWEAVIPSMGMMALLRNLRNFDEAGVSDDVAARVALRLADPEEVARSRQFPFRFLAAYKHAPSLRWAYALEQALGHSLANVPRLQGRTLVLVDRSGSMFGSISDRTKLNRADSAAIFGAAIAARAENADLVEFGTTSKPVTFGKGESLLRVLERFHDLGGTNTTAAVRAHYARHDRVLIVTDEQASFNWQGDPTSQVPANVPVYTWNLAGYQAGHGPSGQGNRHTFGGLTDQAFGMIPLLEAGRDARWPWEEQR